ncbi:hypothetical protein GUJ93_ZPchr0006g45663 [Zizania palustris]|uniref:Uncharacterized protein n=1 Tax=Zizania palustris TaxID=103762 RepID=A0A8J5TGV1_ZIZPA|nr:hypothetical protein GUJ93_ZPchr0006g45663 [Zizania palustris]
MVQNDAKAVTSSIQSSPVEKHGSTAGNELDVAVTELLQLPLQSSPSPSPVLASMSVGVSRWKKQSGVHRTALGAHTVAAAVSMSALEATACWCPITEMDDATTVAPACGVPVPPQLTVPTTFRPSVLFQ